MAADRRGRGGRAVARTRAVARSRAVVRNPAAVRIRAAVRSQAGLRSRKGLRARAAVRNRVAVRTQAAARTPGACRSREAVRSRAQVREPGAGRRPVAGRGPVAGAAVVRPPAAARRRAATPGPAARWPGTAARQPGAPARVGPAGSTRPAEWCRRGSGGGDASRAAASRRATVAPRRADSHGKLPRPRRPWGSADPAPSARGCPVTPGRRGADVRVVTADLEDWISDLTGGEPSVRRLRKRLEATLDGSLVVRSTRDRDGDRQAAPADVRVDQVTAATT